MVHPPQQSTPARPDHVPERAGWQSLAVQNNLPRTGRQTRQTYDEN